MRSDRRSIPTPYVGVFSEKRGSVSLCSQNDGMFSGNDSMSKVGDEGWTWKNAVVHSDVSIGGMKKHDQSTFVGKERSDLVHPPGHLKSSRCRPNNKSLKPNYSL